MYLLLGGADDPLLQFLRLRLGPGALRIDEQVLFGATSFWVERSGTRIWGDLRIPETADTPAIHVPLQEVAGVVDRMQHAWQPGDSFAAEDQGFVHHETAAAWISLLLHLPCPVVNRFGIGHWLRDPLYYETLRRELARRAGLRTAAGVQPAGHAYLVGDALIGDPAPPELAEADAHLSSFRQSSGISFCRLDFARTPESALLRVDPLPDLTQTDPALVARLGSAMLELLR